MGDVFKTREGRICRRRLGRRLLHGRHAPVALALWLVSAGLLCSGLMAVSPAPAQPGNDLSPAAAQSLASKIALLSSGKSAPSDPATPVQVSDAEANSYLKFRGHEFLPAAVLDPQIHITPEGISGTADVDFDKLGKIGEETNDWGARIVAAIFKGKQHVLATGKLETSEGKGKLTIESLIVGGTSIPAGFVNFMIQNYMERKYGIDLSQSFDLPAQVSHIEMKSGYAFFYRLVRAKPKITTAN